MKINLNDSALHSLLSPREKHAHKGLYGHALIVGGGLGMPGAVTLAAHAALRVGAGCVTIATRSEYAKQVLPGLPEVMISGINHHNDLEPLLAKATVCLLGPGLGEDEWAKDLYSSLISTRHPLLVDASALRLLAASPLQNDNWILTPHPGEAAALLGCSCEEIQDHRQDAVTRLQKRYHGTIVLKGHETLIANAAQAISICTAGNPGMATAGMGDVLSGVIAGLMAQNIALADAARLGVWMHATAGDRAAKVRGERGLMASDLMPFLQQLSNPTTN